jgi:hypothetical protein
VSLVGREYYTEERVVGYYVCGDRMKYWGRMGVFWGGVWGLLIGAAFFVTPGIGPVLVAGPLVTWIVRALEGAAVAGGLSAVGAALYIIGIRKDNIVRYESAIREDKFLLLAHGDSEEVNNAREILRITRPEEMSVHFSEDHIDALAAIVRSKGQADRGVRIRNALLSQPAGGLRAGRAGREC